MALPDPITFQTYVTTVVSVVAIVLCLVLGRCRRKTHQGRTSGAGIRSKGGLRNSGD
jgi:hypothetical protein